MEPIEYFKIYHIKPEVVLANKRVMFTPTNYFRVMNSDMINETHELVAIINSNLKNTFELTNHIDSEWHKGEKVITVFVKNPRSTMVGDIVYNIGTGEYFLVDNFGYKELIIKK